MERLPARCSEGGVGSRGVSKESKEDKKQSLCCGRSPSQDACGRYQRQRRGADLESVQRNSVRTGVNKGKPEKQPVEWLNPPKLDARQASTAHFLYTVCYQTIGNLETMHD